MKKCILIFAGYYTPSIKAGGPVQSLKNLINNLSDRFDFYIVASDRDLGDSKPFDNIQPNKWIKVGDAKVLYTDISKLKWKRTITIINSVNYDVIYLNSFFSYKFSTVPLLLRKFNLIPKRSIVLAPRGQFSTGALSLKSSKKKFFINITKALRLYKNITWHATADTEKEDIEKIFSEKDNIVVVNNLTTNYKELIYNKEIEKRKGELKIIFVSRVHPKKNLKKAIELLTEVNGEIEFNIYGPIEDENYWIDCVKAIKNLPKHIKVSYKGILNHNDVIKVFKSHHVFLFPTLGENFGHVISEALIGGCPVILSDQTPWRNLESMRVGWDITLQNEKRFIEVINHCVKLDDIEYTNISEQAFHYGKKMSNSDMNIKSYYNLFENYKSI